MSRWAGLLGVLMLVLTPGARGTARAEEVESPQYASWARHPVGTTVRLRTVTEAAGARSIETTASYRLVKTTADAVVVEMKVVSDAPGSEPEGTSQELTIRRLFPLFPGVKKEDIGKPEGVTKQGEEAVTVAGRTYRARWYEGRGATEAGPSESRTWTSDEVPGRLIRSVTKVPKANKTVTQELVAIEANGTGG
jgi:hypothetical protein